MDFKDKKRKQPDISVAQDSSLRTDSKLPKKDILTKLADVVDSSDEVEPEQKTEKKEDFKQNLLSSLHVNESNERVLYNTLVLFPQNRVLILDKANNSEFEINFKELLKLCFESKNAELLEFILSNKPIYKKDLDVFVFALENFDNSTFVLLDKLDNPNDINYSDLVEHLLNQKSELAFRNYIDFLLKSYDEDDNLLKNNKLMCHKDCESCKIAEEENINKSKNDFKSICPKKLHKIELLQSKANFWEILFLKSLENEQKSFYLPCIMKSITVDVSYNPLHIIVDLNAPLSKKIELFEKCFQLPVNMMDTMYNRKYINIAEPYGETPISRLVNSANLEDEEELYNLISKAYNVRPDIAGKTGSKPCLMQRVIEKRFWKLTDKCLDMLKVVLNMTGINKSHVLREAQGSRLTIDFNNVKDLSQNLLKAIEHHKQVEESKKEKNSDYQIEPLVVPLLHALCYYGRLDLIRKAIDIGFIKDQVTEVCGQSSVGKDLEIYPKDMVRDNDPCRTAILELLGDRN